MVTLVLVVVASLAYLYYDKFVNKPKKPFELVSRSTGSDSKTNFSSGDSFVDKIKDEGINLLILYGSQTGTAEDFAARLSTEATLYGLKALPYDMEDCEAADLERMKECENAAIVLCLATYGEGDPTDNAIDFHQWLKDDGEGVSLEGVNYTVFALGNSTYEHYQAVGRLADKVLKRLGATQVCARGEGDDDKNIEEDFIKWKKGMFRSMCKQFNMEVPEGVENAVAARQYKLTEVNTAEKKVRVYEGEMGRHRSIPFPRTFVPDSKNPQMVRVKVNRELYKDKTRSCRHVELDISGTKIKYYAGDHVGIYPTNNTDLVLEMGRLLQVNLDAVLKLEPTEANASKRVPFPSPCTYRAAFAHYLDINQHPKPHQLRQMAQYAEGQDKEFLLHLASEKGAEEYNKWVLTECRTYAEVIKSLNTLNPPADLIIEIMPRLQPRYYSISSSNKAHPDSIHVTAVVVEYDTPTGRSVQGVCTSYLQNISCDDSYDLPEVPIFVRHSTFRLPKSISTPIVMIGPGTGLAPFRGFLQDREQDMLKLEGDDKLGKSMLFYGCRNRNEDYLYQEELEAFNASGVVDDLQVAFSRESAEKVYVSHLMKQHKKQIWDMLDQKGHIYVCGDARNMAKDVHQILHDLIVEHGGHSFEGAEKYIRDLQSRGRYAQDVWS
ncbi:hypothetical protein SARC_08600 [Sphaeroforma arctica JP610]|uniref:NADPH--cytochrome P450 reductase n=1 Tax=Sphaeroforma arctica JP610 TaxID=667725 RepID=A0A0L0FQB9_9EUKA|nr:hypothetical protein SARC_08600 [Sphaeroforma arctica JP610]KNC78985.1 hypothetical protein SARC_08600 [Sphaeroforma arctica JP610]|eukprot:XP_014152887.1 hypothetical protein SARC_08600 [Sphaeroforma arctica JP610]